jgi:hypothetical protein
MFLEGVVRLATPRVRNRGLGRRRPSVLRPVGRLDSGRFRIELRFVFCFVNVSFMNAVIAESRIEGERCPELRNCQVTPKMRFGAESAHSHFSAAPA